MYGHCVSSLELLARFVLLVMRHMKTPIHDRDSICTSRNETHEDSHTRSRLMCTNPSWAIHSLACGMRDLTRASNNTCEKTTQVVNLDVSCTIRYTDNTHS